MSLKRYVTSLIMLSSAIGLPLTASAQAGCGSFSGTLEDTDHYLPSDGDPVYVGQICDGSPHGQGRAEFNDGSWYEGTFDNGSLATGYGHFIDDDSVYTGQFKDDDYHGFGTLKGQIIFYDENQSYTYVGNFEDGDLHGYGKLTSNQGEWFNGTFDLGDPHDGSGKVTYLDDLYEGRFVEGELQKLTPETFKIKVQDGDAKPLVRFPGIVPSRFMDTTDFSGFCRVKFDVSPEGTPYNVKTTYCTSALLERASIKAVGKWKYKPKILNGKPVAHRDVASKISYHIEDERGQILPFPPGSETR